MPSWKKVIVSGSDASLNSINVATNVVAQSFTGSLQGTASYAVNADFLDGRDSTVFATTGSNIFKGLQTIDGDLFMSGSFPLIYNNDATNNMLFGMFDGSAIYGPYYQLFGNQYPNIVQRGGAEFVYDIRNNANADFHIASFNGSTWTTKFVVNDIGTQVTGSLGVTGGITGSLLGTASYASSALSSSYAITASYTDYAISSSHAISASYASNADLLDGKDSTVFATTGSNIFIGNQTVTGSLFTTGSNTLVGSTFLTGSLNITGSTLQTGNNTLLGNTLLTGSITISGSTTPGSPTASVQIYGDIRQSGYHRFDPVVTNIDNSISASYIYVSGSTNDLYFTQNGSGYGNTTRLRWLEGNLYTGLLHGGLITTQSSTVYQISSGSGIIVSLNASLSNDPYPTIQFLQWPNLSASIAPLTASYQQAFVGIDSTNNIYAQGTPFNNGQFNTIINIGSVLFQNQSTINGVKTQPSVAYGFEQSQNIFNRAFGPLKLSGYTLAPSGSSTGSLVVGSGTAYAPGSNYSVDPNEPSYTVDSGTNVSKIFRYHQSGSTWVYDTNAGAGYPTINPGQYSNNGTLTSVGAGNWSIQRVFYFPNSVTKAIVVYYGNAIYATENDALANIPFESFVEAPNTAANAIYLGAIVISGNGVLTNTNTFTIYPGGLFRQVGGSGGGGSTVTQTLSSLSDVNISGPTDGQALIYDTNALKWENKSFFSGSISGNAATATTASFAVTASYAFNAVSSSHAISASYAISASHAENANTASYVLNAVSASYAATASSADNFLVRGTLTAQTIVAQTITSSVEYITGSTQFGSLLTNTHQFTGSVSITGSLTSPAITGSLLGTASYAIQALSASHATTASYANFASTSSNVQGGTQFYVPLWNTNTSLTSSYLNQSGSVLKTIYNGTDRGLTLDYNFDSFILGNPGVGNSTYLQVFDGGSTINVYSPNYTYFNDKVGVRIIPTNPGLAVSGALEITGPSTSKFMNSNVQITGSLNVTGGITGSLLGTSSYASQALSSSYAVTSSYADFASSSSQAQNATTASHAPSALSASYAITASYALFAANGGGGGGGGATVTHTQLTASTTWSFGHNLNTLTPLLQVYDLNYEQIIPNEIVSINAFTSEIRFDYTQAGYAVASSGGGLTVIGSTPRLTQTVAATTWSFAHNLGTQYPGFEVFDQNDYVIIPAGIYAIDENNAEIYFATPSTGVAIANFSGINGVVPAATSASYAATSSYSDQFHIGGTQTQYALVTSSINGSNIVFNVATGSYSSAFFKYTVASASNARSGEIMSVWNGSTVTFTDNSTTDIGTTTAVTSSVTLSGANVRLNMQTNTAGWRIKSIATFM